MEPVKNENESSTKELEIVKLSPSAVSEVKRRLAEKNNADASQSTSPAKSEWGLRLGVKGGGCSGLSYIIDMGLSKDNDHIHHHYGFPIFIDPKSGLYLKDVELDYEGGFMGSGFKFKNPNATNTCGCGESFSL